MALKIHVASPCSEKWESMTGDERVRHCAKCRLDVFNLAQLSEAEARALLEGKTGRVCGRIFQRRDGTVLTKDCPVGLARARRQVALVVAAVLTPVLTPVLGALGLRPKPACAHPGSTAPRTGLVGKAEAWKASLRATRTFGPLIEWIDPTPRVMAGEISLPPPATPGR